MPVAFSACFLPVAVICFQLVSAFLLVAEYLDDFLAVDHLFDISIQRGEAGLLKHGFGSDLSGQLLRDGKDDH